MAVFVDSLAFLLAIFGLFFLPGYIALSLIRLPLVQPFERMVFAVALSLGLVNVIMLVLDRLGFTLSATNIGVTLAATLGLWWLGLILWRRFGTGPKTSGGPVEIPWAFSHVGGWLFLSLLIATLLVKTLYLSNTILPTATDLGHHMYWSKLIAVTGNIPAYEKQEVTLLPDGSATLSAPLPIDDFIVGEHLPFAALSIFSGMSFFGAGPIVFLLLLNLLSLLALLALAWRIASDLVPRQSELLVLSVFLVLGPLYALASPQAKFVSGGVVGNIFGNFFIPIILLAFLRAFRERRSDSLVFAVFFAFILAFTHHLSTLILLFVLIGLGGVFLVMNYATLGSVLRSWIGVIAQPWVGLLAVGILAFLVLVAVPSYLDRTAIDTAIGTPTKTTRTGLSFLQATNSVGAMKMGLGLAGLALLLFLPLRKTYGAALLIGWSGVLLSMTLFPHLLFLDIPSGRIGHYLTFPIALSAGWALVALGARWFRQPTPAPTTRVPALALGLLVLVLLVSTIANGTLENSQTLADKDKSQAVTQTMAVSRYLADETGLTDIILKDHNYIVGDAWMKLFFLRDYGYPLSRGFFSRYTEGGSRREQCTLRMISVPNTPEGKRCFEDIGVNLIVVNPRYDVTQFEKSRNFSRWYASPDIHAYSRN